MNCLWDYMDKFLCGLRNEQCKKVKFVCGLGNDSCILDTRKLEKGKIGKIYTYLGSGCCIITPCFFFHSFLLTWDFSMRITPEFSWFSIYITPAPVLPFIHHTYCRKLFLPFVCFTCKENTISLSHLRWLKFLNMSPYDILHYFITPFIFSNSLLC